MTDKNNAGNNLADLGKNVSNPKVTEKMLWAGMEELMRDRSFEHNWQVVLRIYLAMRQAAD